MKKILLTASIVAGLTATLGAQINFVVDSTATWGAFVNTFDKGTDGHLFGFGEGNPSTMSANFNVAGDELTLSPNSRIFDEENGKGDDTDWINETTGESNWYIEGLYFQELNAPGTDGQAVTFSYEVLSNDLPTTTSYGYQASAFIKVLDGFTTWATVQIESAPLTVGSNTISLVIDESQLITGTTFIQAGFSVIGDIQPTLDPVTFGPNPILDTGAVINAVPEPSTYAILLGFAALGFVMYRRRK